MTAGSALVAAPAGSLHAPAQLRDSTPLVRSTQDPAGSVADRASASARVAERFRRDGYLWLRGWLPATEVLEVAIEVTAALVGQGMVDDRLHPQLPVPVFGDERYLASLREVMVIEAIHRLAHRSALVSVARLLVGEEEIIVHPRKVARFAHPEWAAPGTATGAHQDHTYVQGGADGLTMWVPLTPAPRLRASLAVLVGSAREGLREACPSATPYRTGPTRPRVTDVGRWASADFEPGDVLVMHGFTVHGSLPNLSDVTRLSLDFRYRGVSQPLSPNEMWPQHHPALGPWAELARDWQSHAWLSVPTGTRVGAFRRPADGLSVPPSALMGTPAAELPPVTADPAS
jgi:hypothetical protein